MEKQSLPHPFELENNPIEFSAALSGVTQNLYNILSQVASWQVTDPQTYLPEGFHAVLHQMDAGASSLLWIILGLLLLTHY